MCKWALGCSNKVLARGYCKNHYYILKRAGDLPVIQKHNIKRLVCNVDGCKNISTAKGLCIKHYKYNSRHGIVEKVIDKSNWNPENIAWIAGIIEGEGNFNLRKSKKSFRIRVRMTDLDVIEKCLSITKCGIINGPYFNKNPKYKPSWEWAVNSSLEVYELIEVIKPWLCSRRSLKLKEIYSEWEYALT